MRIRADGVISKQCMAYSGISYAVVYEEEEIRKAADLRETKSELVWQRRRTVRK